MLKKRENKNSRGEGITLHNSCSDLEFHLDFIGTKSIYFATEPINLMIWDI